MDIPRFELERYFARHEFSVQYMLSCSDCEPMGMPELLTLADDEISALWRTCRLGYTESSGHPLLREEIAVAIEGMSAANILVGAPEECIFLTMTALLSPGDHVVCTAPGYQSLYEVARWMGCDVSLWWPREEEGWRFDTEDLGRLLRDDTRLVAVNFPHNPTGAMLSVSEFEELVARVQAADAYLLSDEMYRGLEYSDADRLPAACALSDHAVSLSGMSKVYGLAGLRIGWLVSHDLQALERIAAMKDYTTICSSAPSELLALVALRNRDQLVEGQRRRVRRNLDELIRFVERSSAWLAWSRPHAGPVAFPRLPFTENTDRFCSELVEQARILLLPGSVFSYGNRHVRIGFGREDFPEVLACFEEALRGTARRA